MVISPSSELVAREVDRELQIQLQHFEAIDSKAGLLLGFSGALVALVGTGSSLASQTLRGFAACAALSALASFWPRSFATMNVRALRDKYLQADANFTARALVDTQIQMVQEISGTLQTKGRWLKVAISFLVMATVVSGALIPLFPGELL